MGAVRMMVIAAAISAAVVSQLGYWSPNALELTHQGVLPPPSGRVVKSFDLDAACRRFGFRPLDDRNSATDWRGESTVDEQRTERVDVTLRLCDDAIAARDVLLARQRDSEAILSYAVGQAGLRAHLAQNRDRQPFGLRFVEGPPLAGEASATWELPERPLSSLSLVRDNCVVHAHLAPWVDGRWTAPDQESDARLVEFVQGLDKLLIAASEPEEGENPWTPNIDAILIELPMPAAGRQFTIDARVSAAGEPAPAARLSVSWEFRHTKNPGRIVVSPPEPVTTLGVTSARVELEDPGWWTVTCHADLDGSLHGEKRMLLYVLPAGAEPAEAL